MPSLVMYACMYACMYVCMYVCRVPVITEVDLQFGDTCKIVSKYPYPYPDLYECQPLV